jgi:hypothetical protein
MFCVTAAAATKNGLLNQRASSRTGKKNLAAAPFSHLNEEEEEEEEEEPFSC